MVYRNKKRKAASDLYKKRRDDIKKEISQAKQEKNIEEIFLLYQKLAKMPRKSSETRVNSICFITGRSRGVYKRFGLSRIKIREMASYAEIPGIKKSSW